MRGKIKAILNKLGLRKKRIADVLGEPQMPVMDDYRLERRRTAEYLYSLGKIRKGLMEKIKSGYKAGYKDGYDDRVEAEYDKGYGVGYQEGWKDGEAIGYNCGVDDARAMTPEALKWRLGLEEVTKSAIADPWRLRWALKVSTSSLETGRQFSELKFWGALKEAATMTEEACRAEVEK